jgi:hypothetical protein
MYGYFPGYKNVENIDGSAVNTVVTMLNQINIGTVPGTGGTVSNSNGLQVITQSGAFTNANGTVYNGTVTVFAQYITASDSTIIFTTMPGGNMAAVDSVGNPGIMQTYGFIATQFEDNNNNLLTPVAGKVQAYLTIPASEGDPISNGAQAWQFDAGSGLWKNSVALTSRPRSAGRSRVTSRSAGIYCPIGTIYENVDEIHNGIGTIIGKVMNCQTNKPIANVEVIIKSQYIANDNNEYITYTNQNGIYEQSVNAATALTYTITADGVSVTVSDVAQNTIVTAPVICITTGSNTDSTLSQVLAGNGTTIWDGNSYYDNNYDWGYNFVATFHSNFSFIFGDNSGTPGDTGIWSTLNNNKIVFQIQKGSDKGDIDTFTLTSYTTTVLTLDTIDNEGSGSSQWIKQ